MKGPVLLLQVLVKHGALVAMANKYGDTPLSKARPRLRKKLEGTSIYTCTCTGIYLYMSCIYTVHTCTFTHVLIYTLYNVYTYMDKCIYMYVRT